MFGWFRNRRPPFVGTWLLVQADGGPPESMGILSMRLFIGSDGVLSWESRMRGPWDGMTLRGNGHWSASGKYVTCFGKQQASTSVARVDGSRLVLEPDFVLVNNGSTPVVGIYERAQDADPGSAADIGSV